jgi:hypothetical protein
MTDTEPESRVEALTLNPPYIYVDFLVFITSQRMIETKIKQEVEERSNEKTTQNVEHSLQESSRREMNVRAWWDNVRAQLRDEDKLA